MEVFFRSKPYPGPVKGVVLDWAGTTVDFGCIGPVSAFMEVFANRSIEVTTAEAREPMGLMKKDHIRAMIRTGSVATRWREAFGRDPDEADVQAMYLELEPLMISTIAEHAEPVPGLHGAVESMRRSEIKIGSSTGYTRPMMDILVPEAEKRGYRPDSVVCSSDVPRGRPYPYMCYQNAINLDVYPFEAMVKIGDTLADIQEGLTACMWTVAVTRTSSDLGLSEAEAAALPPGELARRMRIIKERFLSAGAHYVIEDIGGAPGVIEEINQLLARGERP